MSNLFPLILLLSVAGMIGWGIVAGVRRSLLEAKHLTIERDLDSKRAWSGYNPLVALLELNQVEADALIQIAEDQGEKDRLRIRWKYTTPSGRQSYSDERVYLADELRPMLRRAKKILRGGKSGLLALNSPC